MIRRFLAGLLWLLLAPTIVVLGFAGYTYFANSSAQSGVLRTAVQPQVVLPWQDATYFLTFSGQTEKSVKAKEEPVDIVLMIDVSGSMTSSLPTMSEAASNVAKELAAGKPGLIRFGLISFDTKAEITTPWTSDPAELEKGLRNLHAFTGDNDTREAYVRLGEMLPKARAEARRVVVFYTDGGLTICGTCPGGPMSASEVVGEAARLRKQGVEIYSVGLPGHESEPLMLDVTGSSARVFDPADYRDLARNFRFVASSVMPALGTGGIFSHRLDGRHFAAPLEGTAWHLGPGGALELEVTSVPKSPATYAHPLKPLSMGLWRVGVEPPKLTFISDSGVMSEIRAARRPLLFVVTWLFLIPFLLPTLMWGLVCFWPRSEKQPSAIKVPPPSLRHAPLPTRLPAIPPLTEERQPAIPTIFIGLGGAGRAAVRAARAELKQAHLGRQGQPYRFVTFDFDSHEAPGEAVFDDWGDYPIEAVVAPRAIQQVEDYLPKSYERPLHLGWFNAESYDHATRAQLNLSQGARGDRTLARLALFRWLADGDLLDRITRSSGELLNLPSEDGTRQVVIFASADGGFGSGSFLDFARVVQRFFRQQQALNQGFVPDMVGVLCENPSSPPQNREAIALELESALRCGEFPQRVVYSPGRDLLDGRDTESPYHWVFGASGRDAVSVAGHCGELTAVLVERRARLTLLGAAGGMGDRRPFPTHVAAVHVVPTLVQEQVYFDLLLRLLGPDVLLDVEPDPDGGYRPKSMSKDAVQDVLTDWGLAEPPGSLLQLLLAATADRNAVGPFVLEAGRTDPGWLGDVLLASLNQKIQGHRDAHGVGWRRDWMPGTAIAALRLLIERLDTLRIALRAENIQTVTVEAVDSVRQLTQSSADELERWISDLCRICEDLSRQRAALAHVRTRLRQITGRVYIDQPVHGKEIEVGSMESLQSWLQTPDTISPLRERLFFVVRGSGQSARVVLRSCIEETTDFTAAEPAVISLGRMAGILAGTTNAMSIDNALAKLPERERAKLGQAMVDVSTSPTQVVLSSPEAASSFSKRVPQPAHHGRRTDVVSDDASAIRRIEIASPTMLEVHQPPFIEPAEQEAERVRRKLEQKHNLTVPLLPSELRIALAHPEAFRSFSRAYKARRIVTRRDALDRMQWYFTDLDQFLTFGHDSTLAAAAANYVWYVENPPAEFPDASGGGAEFRDLNRWALSGGTPDPDTLVLAVIDVYEE